MDLVIIGGGPAGMSAAIYASLLGMDFVILEAEEPGGLTNQAKSIENFLGFRGKSGRAIIETFLSDLYLQGVEIKYPEPVNDVDFVSEIKMVKTVAGKYQAKMVILATGTRFLGLSKTMGIEGEKEFLGKGLSYCPECDGPLFKGKDVMVVGSAYDAFFLKGLAGKTYYLGPIPEKEEKQISRELLVANEIVYLEGKVEKIEGKDFLEKVVVNGKAIPLEGLFITSREVGSELFKKVGIETDEDGYIKVDRRMRTNIPGIFAAGDITGEPWQIAKSLGEGATAALSAYQFLTGKAMHDLGWSLIK